MGKETIWLNYEKWKRTTKIIVMNQLKFVLWLLLINLLNINWKLKPTNTFCITWTFYSLTLPPFPLNLLYFTFFKTEMVTRVKFSKQEAVWQCWCVSSIYISCLYKSPVVFYQKYIALLYSSIKNLPRCLVLPTKYQQARSWVWDPTLIGVIIGQDFVC